MVNTEKRRSERKSVALHAVVGRSMTPLKLPASVQTLNLSRKGALIESRDPLVPEEVCTFSLVTNDGMSGDIQGRVVWVEKITESAHHAGVAFRNLTADEEYLLELQLVRSGK